MTKPAQVGAVMLYKAKGASGARRVVAVVRRETHADHVTVHAAAAL